MATLKDATRGTAGNSARAKPTAKRAASPTREIGAANLCIATSSWSRENPRRSSRNPSAVRLNEAIANRETIGVSGAATAGRPLDSSLYATSPNRGFASTAVRRTSFSAISISLSRLSSF